MLLNKAVCACAARPGGDAHRSRCRPPRRRAAQRIEWTGVMTRWPSAILTSSPPRRLTLHVSHNAPARAPTTVRRPQPLGYSTLAPRLVTGHLPNSPSRMRPPPTARSCPMHRPASRIPHPHPIWTFALFMHKAISYVVLLRLTSPAML
ncbi:hypothetical protein C8Q74DRAFT_1257406 [Fomes fomentarius]|nr:hypothetical protein C8Q74DRAFT_1257406 [Fomes fomentarius]